MRKIVIDGYVSALSESVGTEITDTEYSAILTALTNKPAMSKTVGYKLNDTDLTWVAFPVEISQEEEPTIADKAEAYDILMGGAI